MTDAFTELPALVNYVRNGRCALFVGAGLSLSAGYPDWYGLMAALVKDVEAQPDLAGSAEELQGLLDANRFADVADQCREVFGRTVFTEKLRGLLAQNVKPPEATHRPIVETPYACVVTTNFDTLLEAAYRTWGDGLPKAPTGADLAQHGTLLLDGAFFILKAHGTIDDPESMVFTTADYQRVIHANPAFQAMMSAVLLTHAVLFVGYSLSDPNFRLLMDSQLATFGAAVPPRYALMADVGQHEQAILKRTAGIEVFSFDTTKDGFRPVQDLLTYIRSQTFRSDRGTPPSGGAAGSPRTERVILRPREAVPVLMVSIHSRGPGVEVEYFRTTSDDVDGARVPLEQRWISLGSGMVPWTELQRVIPDAVHFHPDRWRDSVRITGQHMRRIVPPALVMAIEDLAEDVVVVFELGPEVRPLPWEWLELSRGPLALVRPTCRLMGGLSDAARGRPFPRRPMSVLLIGDTLAEADVPHPLPGARTEAHEIAALLKRHNAESRVDVLVGRDASYEKVLAFLLAGGYDIVHFAGHGWYDGEDSYLALHDGRVYSSELVTLLSSHPPAALVLSSHFTGLVPVYADDTSHRHQRMSFEDFNDRIARRKLGFEHAAARAGVGVLVGTLANLSDLGALQCMKRFYGELTEGTPAAIALFRARKEKLPEDDPTPLSYTFSGYPDMRLA